MSERRATRSPRSGSWWSGEPNARPALTTARAPDLARILVHLEIGELQPPRRLGLPAPSQDRMHPCDGLLDAERLRHVVVGTHRQAVHLGFGRVARRQEEDRHPQLVGSEPPLHL
ncbi:MAG TPA: hypothetical protein VGJ23_00210, partial [Gaiellaceae bacterium]